jgi:hypothetical protein
MTFSTAEVTSADEETCFRPGFLSSEFGVHDGRF